MLVAHGLPGHLLQLLERGQILKLLLGLEELLLLVELKLLGCLKDAVLLDLVAFCAFFR